MKFLQLLLGLFIVLIVTTLFIYPFYFSPAATDSKAFKSHHITNHLYQYDETLREWHKLNIPTD